MEMSSQIKKRIFVVEQSARGLGGHHLEYALRIAETADNFEKNLVVSRKFMSKVEFDQAVIHPNYKYGYWDLPGKKLIKILQKITRKNKSSVRGSLKLPKLSVKLYYIFSTFRQPEVFFSLFSDKSNWPPRISTSNVLAFALFGIIIAPFTAVFVVMKVVKRAFPLKLSKNIVYKIISLIKNVAYYMLTVVTLYSLQLKFRQFGRDTKRLFVRNHLTESDLLFFGTIGQTELSALNQVIEFQSRKPKCVVILRREPHENGDKPWNWQRVSNQSRANSIKFYADTLELANTYSELFGFQVEVFPIPAGNVSSNLETTVKEFEISYLGDARSEKGFESYSNLVTNLPESKIFTQLNHADDVDSTLALAIQNIVMSGSEMTLDPMASETYLNTILKSELLWIGYLGENYEKRSSGIFIEGTIRGIPSLVTNGSWMHAEIYRNSLKYWEESMDIKDVDLHNARRGVIKLLTLPSQKVELEFTLTTGISLISSGWSDSRGFVYVALPLLHKSESFQRVNLKNSNCALNVLGIAELNHQALWLGGVVLNNADRAHLAFNEYQELKNSYNEFKSHIPGYIEFHSNASITRILEEVSQ
jgi:hypothetical protein